MTRRQRPLVARLLVSAPRARPAPRLRPTSGASSARAIGPRSALDLEQAEAAFVGRSTSTASRQSASVASPSRTLARRRMRAASRFAAVDDLARDEAVPGQHLAGVDARRGARRRRALPELRRRPHGAQRVVLVRGGDAEDAEELVADACLDRCRRGLDRGARRPRALCTVDCASCLGVEARARRRDLAGERR